MMEATATNDATDDAERQPAAVRWRARFFLNVMSWRSSRRQTVLGATFSPRVRSRCATISPRVMSGVAPTSAARVTSPVTITLGSMTLDASDILYVGAAPSDFISQINIRVPVGVAAGNQPIQIKIGNTTSPAGASLAIAPSN